MRIRASEGFIRKETQKKSAAFARRSEAAEASAEETSTPTESAVPEREGS